MRYIAYKDLIDWGKELRFQGEKEMQAVYDRMPSMEIIRCKECCHAFINTHHENKPLICGDTMMCGTTEPNWFCADGERKENG